MTEPPHDHEREHSEQWRRLLTGDLGRLKYFRKSLGWIPSGPRCKLRLAPLKPPGSVVLRPIGFGPSRSTAACAARASAAWIRSPAARRSSSPFADVRGSTALAERLPAHEFSS